MMDRVNMCPSLRPDSVHGCGHKPDVLSKDLIDPCTPFTAHVREENHVLISSENPVPVEVRHGCDVKVMVLEIFVRIASPIALEFHLEWQG